jgi:hypothetical protein
MVFFDNTRLLPLMLVEKEEVDRAAVVAQATIKHIVALTGNKDAAPQPPPQFAPPRFAPPGGYQSPAKRKREDEEAQRTVQLVADADAFMPKSAIALAAAASEPNASTLDVAGDDGKGGKKRKKEKHRAA